MKKSRKLLSVLLAMIMILSSLTMLASAAPANYKTVDDLKGMNAYSKNGAVTRISTEVRTSMIFDVLDKLLEGANIYPGDIIGGTLGLHLVIDLRSVNGLCETIDGVKSLKSNGLVGAVSWMLGVINDVNVGGWEYDVDRTNSDQLRVIYEITQLLYDNREVVYNVIHSRNIDLGVVGNFVDLSAVTKYIADLPGLIKGLIFPLLIRADDDIAELDVYKNAVSGDGKFEDVLNSFVQGIFADPMNWTSYRENAAGVPCDIDGNTAQGATLPLPQEPEQTANYYVKGVNEDNQNIITRYKFDLGTNAWKEDGVFVKTEETPGKGVYIYAPITGQGENLKYYTAGDEGYFLPNAKDIQFTLKGDDSAASLLYKFIPPVFSAMAPVVLNGSVKKILGEWFGAVYTHVGDVNDGKYVAIEGYEDVAIPNDVFFTQEQGAYLWEWSDYKVIDGKHYYRYEDQIFVSDLSNTNPYFNIINWDYKITGDFLNEYIPTVNGTTVTNSAAGYSSVLQGLNKFLIKVADTVLESGFRSTITLKDGDNSNLVDNAKNLAQTIVKHSPKSIFGDYYQTGYYDLMTNADSPDQDVLNGIAATIIKLVMPQMIIPSAENLAGNSVGAILAATIAELATQLIPKHNYDKLIYANYNNKTFLAGKDNSYWLDVLLTIGTDIGVRYLMDLADMGEGEEQWAGMEAAGWAETKTYTDADLKEINGVKPWEAKVDYIVDWALDNSYMWCWGFENLVNTDGLTIDPATVQDPWVKLDKILTDLLPLKQIINCTPASGMTWLETVLRQDVVLAIADLRIKDLTDLLIVPDGALKNTDILLQIATIVKNLLNTLLYKVGSFTLFDSVSNVNRVDDLLNQENLGVVVRNLLGMIWPAINKDYEITSGASATTKGTEKRDGLLTTVLPIVNMFLGWTTDVQKMARPSIIFRNDQNTSYVYTGTAQTVRVRNDSANMLLKRADGSYDKPYNIVIDNITVNNGSVSFTKGQIIAPGTSADLTFNPASANLQIVVDIEYHYTFKDGSTVGVNQHAYAFNYVSSVKSDIPTTWTSSNSANTQGRSNTINPYIDNLDNFGSTIDGLLVTIENTASVGGSGGKNSSYSGFDGTYIENTGAAFTGVDKGKAIEVRPARYNGTEPNMVSGDSVALGTFKTTATYAWNSNNMTCNFGRIYYANLTPLAQQYAEVEAKAYQRLNFDETADAEWTAYITAMSQAAFYVNGPKLTSTFSNVYTQANLDKAASDLKKAVENLEKKSSAAATAGVLETALATAEPGGNVPEINFQDYELYEYFDYQDERTETRNRLKGYYPPAEPEVKRIEGSYLTAAEINDLVANETNATKADAINATTIARTQKEMDDYNAALAAWRAPSYTALENADEAARLLYYKKFLQPVATNNQFLKREIDFANAQGYVEANYSKDSWAAYQEALTNANTVYANAKALQSEIFNAKYELMRTQNALLLAERSAKDTGAYATLEELAAKAEAIFAAPDCYDVVTAGMTRSDAFAALIKALGYKYTDAAGNEAILYSRSAYDYIKYDREITSNNMAKVAAAEAALQAAIDNFECNIKLEATDNVTVVDPSMYIIDGITPGSIATVEDLLNHVQATNADATLVTTVSKANAFGTGAKVDVQFNGSTIATYNVVIYGDVNGDGAIDGFDAVELDRANNGSTTIDGAYATAADTDANGVVDSLDYASVRAEVQCASAIAQTK